VAASGGSGTTQYLWQLSTNSGVTWSTVTNGGNYSGSTTNTLNLSGVSCEMSGYRYRVIITQSDYVCGLVTSNAGILTVSNPPALSLTGSTICTLPGGNGTITSTTSATGVSYQLYDSSNVATQSAKVGTGSALVWSGLSSGAGYYVIGTNAAGCTSTSNTVTITATPQNTIASGVNRTTCRNTAMSSIRLATTGATGATFAGLPAGVTGSWAAGVATISGTPTASGTFNYTVTTTGGCPPAIATGTITVTTLSTIATGSNQTVCINNAIETITLATSGASGATISGLPSGVTGSWTSDVVTISGTPLVSGNFTYIVTTTGNCTAATASGVLTVNPASVGGIIAGSASVCTGTNSTVLTLSGHTGTIVRWESSLDNFATAGTAISNTTTTYTASNLTATTSYRAIIKNGSCDAVTSAVAAVTVTDAPNAGTLSGTQAVCVGGTTTFSSTITGGAWTSDAAGIATVDSTTGVVTALASGTATITYTVTGTGGCADATATRTVTVSDAPNAGTLSGTQAVCVGGTTTFSSTITGGAWTSDAAGIATVDSTTGVVTALASGTATITYTVTGTGGCADATATRTVTVSDAPNAGTLSGTQAVCVGGTTTFSSTITGGAWTSDAAGIATVDSTTGVVTALASGTATITYTVTGTGGCADAMATRTIAVYSPTVTLTGTTTISEDAIGTVNVTATLSTITYEDVTINLSFSGTASGSDYSASNNTITIPAGSLTSLITVESIDDTAFEGDETVIVTITNVVGGCATEDGAQEVIVTIFDNETAPTLSISNPSVNEGTPAVFTISLSGISSVDTVLEVTTTDGTAGSLDYTATTTTVTIPAGSTSVTVSVPTLTDAIHEPGEDFTLTASVTSGTTSNATASGTATITDTSIVLIANDDIASVDGINGSLEFINVLDNDLRNGLPLDPLTIDIQYKTTIAHFELNSDGTISVKPDTPGGTYNIEYEICEKNNASNCAVGTISVFVEVPAIAIIKTATFNDEDGNGYADAGETITYNFIITNTGNVPLYGITVTDNLPGVVVTGQPITLQVGESDQTSFIASLTISQVDINKGSISNQAVVTANSALGVTVEDQSDHQNNVEDNPTVLGISGCVIKVFNAVSPNNDGDNDEFYIRGIECYPENTVEIYNRWGVLVYAQDRYDNRNVSFKGVSEGRATIKKSEKLPTGTYFYIVKYIDNTAKQNELAGYLYLSN
jgi:gliding motility-associated-like protein